MYINDAIVNQGLALFITDTLEDEMGTEIYSLEGPLQGVRFIKRVPRVVIIQEPLC